MYMRVEMMLPQVPQAVSTPLGHYITWKKYYRIIFILKDVTEFMQINSDDGGFFFPRYSHHVFPRYSASQIVSCMRKNTLQQNPDPSWKNSSLSWGRQTWKNWFPVHVHSVNLQFLSVQPLSCTGETTWNHHCFIILSWVSHISFPGEPAMFHPFFHICPLG